VKHSSHEWARRFLLSKGTALSVPVPYTLNFLHPIPSHPIPSRPFPCPERDGHGNRHGNGHLCVGVGFVGISQANKQPSPTLSQHHVLYPTQCHLTTDFSHHISSLPIILGMKQRHSASSQVCETEVTGSSPGVADAIKIWRNFRFMVQEMFDNTMMTSFAGRLLKIAGFYFFFPFDIGGEGQPIGQA
jgi:hypothetical protein